MFFWLFGGARYQVTTYKATRLQGHMGMCEYLWAQGGPKMVHLEAQNTENWIEWKK